MYACIYVLHTIYWESLMDKSIYQFRGFWNDHECFLATIFYLFIILTKNVYCQLPRPFDHTILIFQMWKELRLPDLALWSLKWNGTIHVNQRARMPNKVKANRVTCKSAEKRVFTILYGNTRRKANRYAFENGMTNVFLTWKDIPGVNTVLMNYKIRHNKKYRPTMRPARYSVAWPDRFFCYYLWWQKNGKTWTEHARVAMEEGLLITLVNHSWLMNIAIFSTWNL